MKIYTSYFGNARRLAEANILQIGVALWKPKFFNGACLKNVTPTKYMLSDECSMEEYLRLYDKILNRQDANKVIEQIKSLSGGRDVALCCYEKPGDFCHRHILAKWLTDNTGIVIEEYNGQKPEETKEEPKKPRFIQMSLF